MNDFIDSGGLNNVEEYGKIKKTYLRYEIETSWGVIAASSSNAVLWGRRCISAAQQHAQVWNVNSGELEQTLLGLDEVSLLRGQGERRGGWVVVGGVI